MTPRQIATLLTLVSALSCSQPTSNNQADNSTTDTTQTETKPTATEKVEKTDSVTIKNNEDGCVRGQAESVIKKSIFPNTTFKLNDDNRTATETVRLKNGDILTINNWGCEYYALTFRFETNRFQADTTNINYWIDKGFLLMREVKNGLDAPLDIEGGEVAMKNYLNEKKEYKLKDWVDYGNETIPNTVTVDRIQKLTDKRCAIELTYSVGPL